MKLVKKGKTLEIYTLSKMVTWFGILFFLIGAIIIFVGSALNLFYDVFLLGFLFLFMALILYFFFSKPTNILRKEGQKLYLNNKFFGNIKDVSLIVDYTRFDSNQFHVFTKGYHVTLKTKDKKAKLGARLKFLFVTRIYHFKRYTKEQVSEISDFLGIPATSS